MKTKERENTNTRPRRDNTKKGIERLDMKFGGKTYDTQLTTSTGDGEKYFMHDIHKLAVDVTFKHMTTKKGIRKYGYRTVAAMYKE